VKRLLALFFLMFSRGHDRDRAPRRHRYAGWVFRTLPGMIDCATFERFLLDYYEGELPAAQAELFERHLSLCGQCRASYLGYVRSIEMGKRLFRDRDAPPPDEVPERLVAAVISAMNAR
jgi:hypothetical protein